MAKLRIETKQGMVEGREENGVRVWKGIPYAKPPVGELRFHAPVAPEPWDGIREAFSFGTVSLQPSSQGAGLFDSGAEPPEVSEDCLYLNVWAPDEPLEAQLPVMVWIHGGAFVAGSGSLPLYDGTRFAQRGKVIVVTFNYRLGPFGFLHLAPLGGSFASNAGLLDQIAALKWVQDNIAAFGGDPNKVTVFGESAGSMSIAALLAMPAAKGLFRQAIMESGASQALPDDGASAIAGGMLQLLGIAPHEAERLKTLPAEQILAAGERLKQQAGGELMMLFQPVVEGNTLPLDPLTAIRNGAAKDIPLLIGTNRDEGALFIRPDSPVMNEEELVQAIKLMTGIEGAEVIARSYPLSTEGQEQLMTDLYFWRSAVQFALGQSEHAPVWMYRFDWTLPSHPLLGKAIHAGEIVFVFNNLEHLKAVGVHADPSMQQLADRIQDAWISFAVYGTPDTEELPWPAYDPHNRTTMIFNNHCEAVKDPDAPKRAMFGL
ncbi:carboxylesterase/lipase family protein [Paenibacillus caui]|uniref:carboxylesterase/lipase family protein n=1 Tax=Paenibacillus caui TaxID=2873927 RepID=UPI001CA9BA69|nr:carboxylesterase/lipase family protein [Paenibacillus caui]